MAQNDNRGNAGGFDRNAQRNAEGANERGKSDHEKRSGSEEADRGAQRQDQAGEGEERGSMLGEEESV